MTEVYDNRMNKEQLLLRAVIAAVKGSFSKFTTAEECRDFIAKNGLKQFVGKHILWTEQKEGHLYWENVYSDIPFSAMKRSMF